MDVQYVLMHWLPSQNRLQFKESEAFLKQYGFEAARTAKGLELYSDKELADDIDFVVWRKRGGSPS